MRLLLSWIGLLILVMCNNPAIAAKKATNPCLAEMDKEIGTLYLCGYGGKFKVLSLSLCFA